MRKEFFPSRDNFDDDCGDAEGASVDRLAALKNADILARSQAQAGRSNAARVIRGQQPNKVADGAITASVADLRGLRVYGRPEDQVIYVYDDPMDGNSEHAIMRIDVSVEPTLVAGLLDDIREAFGGIIAP